MSGPWHRLRVQLMRISRQNRKKVLARVSFGFMHVSGPDPKPLPLLAGWRAEQGNGGGEKESSLLV